FFLQRRRHLIFDKGGDNVELLRGRLEDELVVNLQQHARAEPIAFQAAEEVEHGQLDQVGGGALNLHINGFALRLVALLMGRIFAYAGDPPAAAENRTDVSGLAAGFQESGLVLLNLWVAAEIGVNKAGGLFARDSEALGQAMGTDAVDHAEIDR